jgi:hypothetical protein
MSETRPRLCFVLTTRKPPNTEFLAGSGKVAIAGIGDTTMKKIALIFALAFAITTGITVMTVLADMDLAMASSVGSVVTHPEHANICDETAC